MIGRLELDGAGVRLFKKVSVDWSVPLFPSGHAFLGDTLTRWTFGLLTGCVPGGY